MIIDSIKFNEKKFLFEIKIADEIFSISYEVFEELKLKENMEINIEIFNEIEKENNYQKALKIAEKYINYKFRTEYEVRNRLKKDISNDIAINNIINYYKKLGLIDDMRYAIDFVDYCINVKNESIQATMYKLFNKGISGNIIADTTYKINREIDYKNACIIFEKKYKNMDMSDIKNKKKAFRYLVTKGFKTDTINRVLGSNFE